MSSLNLECLKIDKMATGFWEMFHYLTEHNPEKEKIFLVDCEGKDRQYIGLYSIKLRKKRLKEKKYHNESEFISHFQKDKRAALERLFQEPLNIKKINLIHHDPSHIFNIHSKCNFDIWFMEFILLFQ